MYRYLLFILLLGATAGCVAKTSTVAPSLTFAADGVDSELFVAGDRVVEVRLKDAFFRSGTILEWRWIAPDGSVQRREWRLLADAGDTLLLPLEERGAVRPLGRWRVVVSAGEKTVAEGGFHLVENRQRWLARHAGHSHQRAEALRELCGGGEFDFLAQSFGFGLEPVEQAAILDCLAGDLGSAPVLASLVVDGGEDETLLALVYQVKRRLIDALLAGAEGTEKRLQAFGTMLTQWDGLLLERLQGATDPVLRAEAAQLLGRSRSPEAEVLLERGIKDEWPVVRLATVEALRALGTPSARRRLADWWQAETEPFVRERIGEALAQFREKSQR